MKARTGRRRTRGNALALAVLFAAVLLRPTSAQDPQREAADLARQAMDKMIRGDFKSGLGLAEKAVALDPRCGPGLGARGYGRSIQGQYLAAIEDLARAVDLDAGNIYWPWQLCKCYMALDRWPAALASADAAYGRDKAPAFLSLRGLARINLGDVDAGLAEMDQAFRARPEAALINRFDGYLFKADWKELVEEGKRFLATKQPGSHACFYQVVGLMELGEYDAARQVTEDAEARYPQYMETRLCRARLHGTAAAGAFFDPDRALAAVRSGQRAQAQFQAIVVNAVARTQFEAGRWNETVDELETHGRLTNFETLFLLGAAHFRLGRFVEARRFLSDARRLNPYLARHAERVPGLTAFLSGFDRELETENQAASRKDLGEEQATSALTVAEIETLVRRFRFQRALAEYEGWLATVKSPVRKHEGEQRRDELSGLASLFHKLIEKLNSGALRDFSVDVDGVAVTLTKALDDERFEYRLKKGSGKGLWPGLGAGTMIDFLERAGPTPAERLGLGILATEAGLEEKGMGFLQAAVAADRSLQPRLDAFLARLRGVPSPEGGFIPYQGRFVTPEEKANLEKGLVRFHGEWVTPADREKLAHGMIKVGEQWVTGEEAELLKRGYRKHKDKWYTREEFEELHRKWDAAYQMQTVHYDIRTNKSEAFAKELALLIERTWDECRLLHGGKEPVLAGKTRMTLYAFATFEDYRKYCADTHHEAELQAAGFAGSDTNIVAGWDKTGNAQQFLQTMSHEAAHLYYFRALPAGRPPSWYAEGLATQLEGFKWNGKEYEFDRVSPSRLAFIRQAIDAKKPFALEALVAADALALIDADPPRALTFYAECWALVYFLGHTSDLKHVESFRRYREAIDGGGSASLKEYFPDPEQMEKDFLRFVKGL